MNPPQRSPVSVCIIAGNEAHRITPALQSVADWVSEIIVVINDDVNDGTDKIVESFGGKVFREPWKGFGPQKNFAVAQAAQDWILNLDADEEISPALRAEIQRAVRDPGLHAAFSFPRLTQFCGRWIRHGDWYPDYQIRLWRRGRVRWSDAPVHESPQVNGTVGRLRSNLQHYSMESVEHQLQKTIRYANDFAADCQARGRKVGFLDLCLRPPWRFVRSYVFKLGFLDGWRGFSIAWLTAFYTFLRYFKAFEAQNRQASPSK
jgi:glycosyltransferase involved in cell wall biosynthesis